ncbi:MAG: aminotransferase class IV [Bacteroidia bacterium]|nr:MAG: aminotransferase class IV [Bacteroidia bacterium]
MNNTTKKYIYNGEIVTAAQIIDIAFNNRAFRFGDALFETIRYSNKNILFLADHILRLKLSMPVLKMKTPSYFSFEYFLNKISDLIYANDLQHKNARIRLTVFRKGSGVYYPETNEVDYLIEADEIENTYYLSPSNGLVVDLFKDIFKPINRLSNLKTGNALIYILAAINRDALRLDDCFIVNEKGHICEATSSNVFAIKGNMVMTPPLTEGCVSGILRNQIKRITENKKLLFIEKLFTSHTLIDADEVFITNTIQGPQWIRQFQSRIYEKKSITQLFVETLNEIIAQ